jgi:hypothetical protein
MFINVKPENHINGRIAKGQAHDIASGEANACHQIMR